MTHRTLIWQWWKDAKIKSWKGCVRAIVAFINFILRPFISYSLSISSNSLYFFKPLPRLGKCTWIHFCDLFWVAFIHFSSAPVETTGLSEAGLGSRPLDRDYATHSQPQNPWSSGLLLFCESFYWFQLAGNQRPYPLLKFPMVPGWCSEEITRKGVRILYEEMWRVIWINEKSTPVYTSKDMLYKW